MDYRTIFEVIELAHQAGQLTGDIKSGLRWLRTPHQDLRGVRPIDHYVVTRDAKEILEMLKVDTWRPDDWSDHIET